jgi:hypothetical protein
VRKPLSSLHIGRDAGLCFRCKVGWTMTRSVQFGQNRAARGRHTGGFHFRSPIAADPPLDPEMGNGLHLRDHNAYVYWERMKFVSFSEVGKRKE